MYKPKGQFQQFVCDKLKEIIKINLNQNHDIANNKKRITKLEKWQIKIITIVGTIGAVVGFIFGILKLITK